VSELDRSLLCRCIHRHTYFPLTGLYPESVGPSHGVQSFRNSLLQHGFPTGSQVLPANLLQRWLLSPQVRRSCQEPGPVQAPHGVTASFGHPPAPAWGPFHRLQVDMCYTMDLHGLQGDNLPYHGIHHKLQGKTLCSGISNTSSPLLLH